MRLKAGQKIVMIGDSITDAGRRDIEPPYGVGYVTLVRSFVTALHPELGLTWVNKGIGGDTVRHLADRWVADVLDEHEQATLLQACRLADLCDDLQRTIESEGLMSESSQGPRVHPAVVELRQQGIALARLLAALRIPAGEADDGRTPARPGARGVYAIRGGGA